MNNPLGFLINPLNQRLLGAVAAILSFVLILSVFISVFLSQAYLELDSRRQASLKALTSRVEAAFTGFGVLQAIGDRKSCSEAVIQKLREASFAPDGINEFVLIADGKIICTSSLGPLAEPYPLSRPEFAAKNGGRYWFDLPLDSFGHKGDRSTLIASGDFAAMLPLAPAAADDPAWLSTEAVMWSGDGHAHHVSGQRGIFETNLANERSWLTVFSKPMSGNACDPDAGYCVASHLSVSQLLLDNLAWVLISLAFSVLAANFIHGKAIDIARRYLSFEARFRRNFRAERILCVYQPVYDTTERAITGCEVLTRWRDLDGSIVYPDRFLPLVEADGLMNELNRMVVARAFAELTGAIPADFPLQVNFNISPSSMNDPELPHLFDDFLALPERFTVAVEIVESEKIDFVEAEALIQRLRMRGIMTYMDDFGVGYSNIENLARLSVDAIKLDKSFALAPAHSLMAEMLDFAIRMIHGLGRSVVVEGVETAERMNHLVHGVLPVHFLQGYFISRPLEVHAFRAFLDQMRHSDNPVEEIQLRA